MLSERKRFNYISQQKTPLCPASTNYEDSSRIFELENTNKRILEETTKQFKKLQNDVQRVESILSEKQTTIKSLKAQNSLLQKQTQKNNEERTALNQEKTILIEALLEKQKLIKQFESRLNEFLLQKKVSCNTPKKINNFGCNTQVEEQPKQEQDQEIQDQIYKLKEDLYDVKNQLALTQNQFQTYKILYSIDQLK